MAMRNNPPVADHLAAMLAELRAEVAELRSQVGRLQGQQAGESAPDPKRVIPASARQSSECLTIRQVAELLKVSRSFVYALIATRQLRAIRRGKRLTRVRRADLDTYLGRLAIERQDRAQAARRKRDTRQPVTRPAPDATDEEE